MRLESTVIGMDFSDTAIKAARWATDYFAPGTATTLAFVIPPPDQPAFAGHLVPSSAAIEAVAREYADTHMSDLADSLKATVIRREIRVGNPHEEIVKLVKEIHADLVVIGPHGDRPRPRKFLGTTAERIVRTSPVPVLVATNPPAGRPRSHPRPRRRLLDHPASPLVDARPRRHLRRRRDAAPRVEQRDLQPRRIDVVCNGEERR